MEVISESGWVRDIEVATPCGTVGSQQGAEIALRPAVRGEGMQHWSAPPRLWSADTGDVAAGAALLSRALGSDGVVRPTRLHHDLARPDQLGDAGGALSGVGLDVHADHETALAKADADTVDSWLGPRRQQHGGDLLIVGLELPPGPWGGPDHQASWLGGAAAQHAPVPVDLGGEQRDDGHGWFVVPVAAAEVVCGLLPAVALHQLQVVSELVLGPRNRISVVHRGDGTAGGSGHGGSGHGRPAGRWWLPPGRRVDQ